jgi:hypothetical protein
VAQEINGLEYLGFRELEIEDKQSWQISGLAIRRLTKNTDEANLGVFLTWKNIYCNGRK